VYIPVPVVEDELLEDDAVVKPPVVELPPPMPDVVEELAVVPPVPVDPVVELWWLQATSRAAAQTTAWRRDKERRIGGAKRGAL